MAVIYFAPGTFDVVWSIFFSNGIRILILLLISLYIMVGEIGSYGNVIYGSAKTNIETI